MKCLYIDNGANTIRLARLEDGDLTELAIENRENETRVGNIYAAVVKNILPARFAFLDIGAEKDAFLYLEDRKERNLFKTEDSKRKLILKNGGETLVQVVKDETRVKGACVTTQLTFANKFFVLIKNFDDSEIGISQKITSAHERERLKKITANVLPPGCGAIIRTEAEGLNESLLKNALAELVTKCENVVSQGICKKAPALVYKEESLLIKSADRMLTRDIDKIIINDMEDGFRNYLDSVYGGFLSRLEVYCEKMPLFERYLIESQIEKALCKKVWLKSGGFIIIEQTEACVVIDVNSGKFIHGGDHAKTISKTNLEAAVEIARQIRLRNLSGMIVIDFINAEDAAETENLTQCLRNSLKIDRVPVNIACVTDMGVIILTRKKSHESIENILTVPCGCCNATGRIRRNFHG